MSSGQEQCPSVLRMQPRGPTSLRGNGDGAGSRPLAVPTSALVPLMTLTMGLGCLGTPTPLSSLIAGTHPSLGTTREQPSLPQGSEGTSILLTYLSQYSFPKLFFC